MVQMTIDAHLRVLGGSMTMSADQIRFAGSEQILKRKAAFERLVKCLFEPDLRPSFVSDKANLLDICGDGAEEIINNIETYYGWHLTMEQLRLPIWKLLDLLEEKGKGDKNGSG
jgi:hypothetical protein